MEDLLSGTVLGVGPTAGHVCLGYNIARANTTSVLQRNGYQPGLWAHHASVSPLLYNGANDRTPSAACWGESSPIRRSDLGCRQEGSPVQVEGSDLCVVPLIVREIKEVRGCLLLPCLPREKGMKQRVYHCQNPPVKGCWWVVLAGKNRLSNFQDC